MRSLVLASGLERDTLDPAGSWLWELTSRLAAKGHRVSVLCVRAPEPGPTFEPPPGVAVAFAHGDTIAPMLSAALETHPDVVHVAVNDALPAEATALLAGRAVLVDLVDWSPLCPATDLLARPRETACESHAPLAACGSCVGHAHLTAMEPLLALARAGHRMVAHSAYVRDRVTLAVGRGVAWVPVGVDTARFTPSPEPPLTPEVAALASERPHPRVMFLGPPTPARGGARLLDLLLALNARLPGVELVVPGSDPADPEAPHMLVAEAKELGLSRQLTFLPSVSHADLPALLRACDVAVAPGLAPDPLGLGLVQALACGVPVVAHPVGATPALLDDGRAGVLASAHSLGPFAEAVAALLADAATRAAIIEQGRLVAIERHDLERAVFDMEALYERVARPRDSRATLPRIRRAAA